MEKLTIKGEAFLLVAPDTTEVGIRIELKDREFETLMKKADKELKKLYEAIKGCGFAREDIRTESMNISPVYESVRDENGEYRQVFKGYSYSQRMTVKFCIDDRKLSMLITAVYSTDVMLDIDLSYSLNDPKNWEDELIRKAVRDASSKADTIADALGVYLDGIEDVRYNVSNNMFCMDTGRMNLARSEDAMFKGSIDLSYSPQDIEIRDEIEISWKIGKRVQSRV